MLVVVKGKVMPAIIESQKTDKKEFGDGPFSPAMENIFKKSQDLLGLLPDHAEKLARQYGSDLGAIHKIVKFNVKFGTPNKDMLRDLKLVAKTNKFSIPQSCQVAVAMDFMEDAGKSYISYGHTEWKLVPFLQEWLDELAVPSTPSVK